MAVKDKVVEFTCPNCKTPITVQSWGTMPRICPNALSCSKKLVFKARGK